LFKGEPWITKKATQPLVESRINQEYSKIQETQKQPRKQPVDKFPYKNVSFTEVGFVTAVIGEITNNSNKNYSMANFLLSIYDKGGKLIGTGDIYINNFLTGQTKTFKAATMPITMDASKVSKYKIQFESGIENSD